MFKGRNLVLFIILINTISAVCQTDKTILLDEIVISKNKINAVDLGIITKISKPKFTRAEKRLQEAKSGIIFPIINSFNGKIETLKKEIIVEKNEIALGKLANIFEDDYYLKTLKIPMDYIKFFQYYIIEDVDFCLALKTNKNDMMMFIMCKLALDFKKSNNI